MDLTYAAGSLSITAALFTSGVLTTGLSLLRHHQRARATQKEQLDYLESLLVEARSATFPVTRRRTWI